MRWPAILLSFSTLGVFGQTSPFTGAALEDPTWDGRYRLILSGHLHGSSRDRSGFPAGTFLANIDTINTLGAHAFLSTGDLFLDPAKDQQRYERALFSKLKVPLFNAPGNHDSNRHYYQRFGDGAALLRVGADRVILLDTERKDGTIDEAQVALFEEVLDGPATPHVWIISHRPLWAEGDDRYGPLFEGNTRSMLRTNYTRTVEPLLSRLAERSKVFWVSGSMAGNARTSFFFQEHEPGITFIQSAIRNEPWDALLIADVSPDTIIWSSFSLTGEPVLFPQAYDADWWWSQRSARPPFNYRLIPYYIKMTLLQPAFWYGAVLGLLITLLVVRLLRRRRMS